MAELARFQNFAKLKDTEIEFNDITVLAGKPRTGKSYVMKMVYIINEASFQEYKNDGINYFTIMSFLDNLYINKELPQKIGFLYGLLEDKKNYLKILDYIVESNVSNKETFLRKLKKIIKENKNIEFYLNNLINSVFINSKQISNSYRIIFNNIKLDYKNEKLLIEQKKLYGNQNEIIFVETPLILEFHKHIDRRKAKTPYHIESLINILDEDYSFTDEEQDKFIKDFSQKVNDIIGGNIKNQNGSFVFSRNNDKDYNIFNTSSGTKSIGLLQYLVTNKALKKGSVLFWEEPEVHLHPEWQLRMVELFIELMNAGVKIVFSTHSPYMADYLNAISQKRDFEDRVSFNLLQESEGIVENHVLKTNEDWKMIQTELLDPLEEIMWEYI